MFSALLRFKRDVLSPYLFEKKIWQPFIVSEENRALLYTCTPDVHRLAVRFPQDHLRAHEVGGANTAAVDALFALVHPAGQLDGHSETT